MCSNACDNDIEDVTRDTESCKFICENALCRRCSEKACVVLRKKDPLCKTCFLSYCTHKFRSTIGKSHQVKPKHRVLAAFSGGSSSTALLHMINQGLAEESHKKFLFKPFLLFIDESPYPGWSEEESLKFHETVLEHMISSGHPSFITSLSTMFRNSEDSVSYSQVQSKEGALDFLKECSLKSRLGSCLDDIGAVSYKEDFLKHIRWNLIRSVAAAEKMDCVFSGECCTLLATHVLTSMVLGRGSQVAQDTAFSDSLKVPPVLRPLREFQSKEIAVYNRLQHLQPAVHPTLTANLPPFSSLHQVTEDFIVELQRDFPATVSTIFRTGDKLSSSSVSLCKKCLMCHASIDTDLPDSSAVAALKLSERLSKLQVKEEECSTNGCCGQCDLPSGKEDLTSDRLKFNLCFGCQKIIQSMKSISLLPPDILHHAQTIGNRQKMKDAIKDYLLDDNCT